MCGWFWNKDQCGELRYVCGLWKCSGLCQDVCAVVEPFEQLSICDMGFILLMEVIERIPGDGRGVGDRDAAE